MEDCRTCRYNGYRKLNQPEWVFCEHPTTLEKTPRWERGDPAMVDWRTADVHVSSVNKMGECPAWETA